MPAPRPSTAALGLIKRLFSLDPAWGGPADALEYKAPPTPLPSNLPASVTTDPPAPSPLAITFSNYASYRTQHARSNCAAKPNKDNALSPQSLRHHFRANRLTNESAVAFDRSRTDCIVRNDHSPKIRDKQIAATDAARLKQDGDPAERAKSCFVLPSPKT